MEAGSAESAHCPWSGKLPMRSSPGQMGALTWPTDEMGYGLHSDSPTLASSVWTQCSSCAVDLGAHQHPQGPASSPPKHWEGKSGQLFTGSWHLLTLYRTNLSYYILFGLVATPGDAQRLFSVLGLGVTSSSA